MSDPGGGGGGADFGKLIGQALLALLNPDCANLFGGLNNAVAALSNSSYNMYTGQANPYPNRIPSQTWTGIVNDFRNLDTYGHTFWSSSRPGGIMFFGNNFGTLDPGFPPTPNGFTQMTGFLHEFEHAANHSNALDRAIDASPAAYKRRLSKAKYQLYAQADRDPECSDHRPIDATMRHRHEKFTLETNHKYWVRSYCNGFPWVAQLGSAAG